MDTSPEYVKMCEKATEIQAVKPEGSQGEFVYCEGTAYLEVDDRPLTPFVWLPRQDQLQEMVDTNEDARWARLECKFHDFCSGLTTRYAKGQFLLSMEQLWLAFVMKEKYGKVWNQEKEEWVK